MQKTSDLYKELLASDHRTETRLSIGDPGVLITKKGEGILFGGTRILTGATGADGGYDESILVSMDTKRRVFSKDTPTVGDCFSSYIDIEMHKPYGDITKNARLVPYVRLTDGVRFSEWMMWSIRRALIPDGR